MQKTEQLLSEYVDVKHPTFAYMTKMWGDNLIGLTQEQKLFILHNALEDLTESWDVDPGDDVYRLVNNMCVEISEHSDAIALIKFLAQSL